MKTRFNAILAVLFITSLISGPPRLKAPNTYAQDRYEQTATSPTIAEGGRVAAALQSSPVMFIENVGQFDPGARFQVRGSNGTIYLAGDAIWYTLLDKLASKDTPQNELSSPAGPDLSTDSAPRTGVNIKVSFPDSSPHPVLEPFNRLDTHVSYFLGNDPAKWRSDVPVWGGVRYKDLYPGIDLEITSEEGRWVERVIAAPQSDPNRVGLRVEGAEEIGLAAGGVRLKTAIGEFNLPLLKMVDESGNGSSQLAGISPQIHGDTIAAPFRIAGTSGALKQIDSSLGASDLTYATFLGGVNNDSGYGIAVDTDRAAYVTGETLSSDFPVTTGAYYTSTNGGYDAFVVKVNAIGSDLIYATFLGGGGFPGYDNDYGRGIAVDTSGAAYVTGYTGSSSFPVTIGAYDTSSNGGLDAFVVKLNATGSELVYSTYVGGTSNNNGDYGYSIAVDTTGAAYVTGSTGGNDFPVTPAAFDPSYNGQMEAFVVKLNPAGSDLDYSTFLGGSGNDYGYAIAVDASGAAYVTGSTTSSNFPVTPGAYDLSYGIYYADAFVVKLNSAGSELAYATFLGDSRDDYGYGIAVDTSGAAYVTGFTDSRGFPVTSGAYDTSFNGGQNDIFVAKLNAAGNDLAYATFLGGSSVDASRGIAVDTTGAAFITGITYSSDFPSTVGAFESSYHGGQGDSFVVKVNTNGSNVDYATFLGGSGADYGLSIAVDPSGSAYVTGFTFSSEFPVTIGAFDTSYNGNKDGFVVRSTITTPVSAIFDSSPVSGVYPLTVTFNNRSIGDFNTSLWNFGDGTTSASQSLTHTYSSGGMYTVSLEVSGPGGSDAITHTNYITVLTPVPADLGISKSVNTMDAIPGEAITYTLVYSNGGPATASNVVITDALPAQLSDVAYQSSAAITPTGSLSYTWLVGVLSPGQGGVITVTAVVSPDLSVLPVILTNTATITSSAPENNMNNNADSAGLTVNEVKVAPTGVTVVGPVSGIVSRTHSFVAVVAPISATLPVTYTWFRSGEMPITHSSGLSDTVVLAWGLVGTKVITVSATNEAGMVTGTQAVTIEFFRVYLPFTLRSYTGGW